MATFKDNYDIHDIDIPSLEELQNAQPVVARHAFRQGYHFKDVTSGLCRGFIQANIAGFHESFAKDFAQFCRANEGPLPLLSHYPPGVFSAPDLADDSDIRTDLAAYNVLKHGEYTDVVKDLLHFGDTLKEFAFFYTGCSFTFDKILLDAGIPLEYADNPDSTVSMYTTSVLCHSVGSFRGPMVVSMRPIPRHLIQVAVRATNPLADVHGAPIHIGNPAFIGIQDFYKPEYGDPPPPLKENHIPVYWGCGNTIKEVMKHTKHPLSFTMYSDCMYITDKASGSGGKPVAEEDEPVVVDIVDRPYTASLVAVAALEKIKRLQQILSKMSICTSLKDDALLKTSLLMSHSSSIALTIVLPMGNSTKDHEHRQYTNGLMATVALLSLLQAFGKEVTLFVESDCLSVMQGIIASLVQKGILEKSIKLLQYPDTPVSEQTARHFLTHSDGTTHKFDLLMSLQLTNEVTDAHSVQQQLFLVANDLPMFTAPGVASDLRQSAADLYAITVALYLLRMCPVHDRYRRRGVGFPPSDSDIQKFETALPCIKREASILEILVKHQDGAYDGDTRIDEVLDKEIQSTIEHLLSVLEN